MSIKSFTHELNSRWAKVKRSSERATERLSAALRKPLYNILGMIHLALVTDAGLIIMIFAPNTFRSKDPPISALLLLAYVIGDRVRLRFKHKATISLGFPLVFLTLLVDSPFAALRNAVLGSLLSEALGSMFFSPHRHPWFPALRRALFYAGHHAVAAWTALIAYQLVYREQFLPRLLQNIDTPIDVPATLAYVLVYSLISMLLVWPQDRLIWLLLSSEEEPFVRIDFLTSLLLLPLPASAFYLCKLPLPPIVNAIVIFGVLLPLFVLLFFLARRFSETEEDRAQLALGEEIVVCLGSPANIAEMAEQTLMIMERLVDHRWSAMYSLLDEDLRLCGVKPARGPVQILDPYETEESWWPGLELAQKKSQVAWPSRVKPGQGHLGKLAKSYFSPQFLDQGWEPGTSHELYLPRKTALLVCPIRAKTPEEVEQPFPAPIGMIALARPKRMFTTLDWEKSQALVYKAGNVLLSVQRLEKAMHELYQKVEDYATDREQMRQAMHELLWRQVNMSGFLAVISERSFHGSLRTVLHSLIEGRYGNGVTLTPEELAEVYNIVRDETPGMPPLDADIARLLETVTSSLSLAFSLPYQFPDVVRRAAFKEFYQFLLVALDANTVSRIIALEGQIQSTSDTVREKARQVAWEGRSADATALASKAVEEVENLRETVQRLKEYSQTKDFADQAARLREALTLLEGHEGAVRKRLQDPERFVFLQILSSWRAAITNAFEDLMSGPAHLKASLPNRYALPLKEVTMRLLLENQGPGVASSLMVELESSPDYKVLRGKVNWGTLPADRMAELEFSLQPIGEGPLRLHFRLTYNDPERRGKVQEFADLLHLREAPGDFAEIPNPYTPGNPIKPGNPTFFGREDIFHFICQNVLAPVQKTILVLVGERRTGKTSILKQLSARLNDLSLIPIYVDCQQLGIDPGEKSFFLSLATAIAYGLEEADISVRHLTPQKLGESSQYVFEYQFLPMIRQSIGNRVLLLMIDEFEHLGARVQRGRLPPEIFPYLRHLIQDGDQLAFIFAGTHKIEELMADYWSVLFNMAVYKKVGFLKREEAVGLITDPVQPYRMVYDDLAISEILRLTACHPYFTQLLCYGLVNRCNEDRRNYVTVQDVGDVVEDLLETGRAHLTFLWETSNTDAKLALAALAELRDKMEQVTTAAVADRLSMYQLQLDPGQITKTMEQLAARDIVCESPGHPVFYEFTARLYAHWLRRYKPLSKVAEEISREHISRSTFANT